MIISVSDAWGPALIIATSPGGPNSRREPVIELVREQAARRREAKIRNKGGDRVHIVPGWEVQSVGLAEPIYELITRRRGERD